MHVFEPRWPVDWTHYEPPVPPGSAFRDASELADWCALEPLTLWRLGADVWHLDATGRIRCLTYGSLCDGLRYYAKRPGRLVACADKPADAPCGRYWVTTEPRYPWVRESDVDERDVACFLKLRTSLARRGIWLLDSVVIGYTRWWSMHELTSGTTAWEFPARPRSRLRP